MSDNRTPYDYSRGIPSGDDTERFATVDAASPWYLKRWVLALWGLAVVILVAAIIWGLTILARGNGGGTPAPTPTHTSSATSSTSTASTTTTTEPSTTTEETIEPSPEPSATWTQRHPRHHWWRSNLPPIPPIPHF